MEGSMPGVPVRARVHRSGGFAGIGVDTVADTDSLPAGDAEELRRLVAAADLAELVPRLATNDPAQGRPDGFQYDVTVQEGERMYQFTVHDGAVPPDLKPLLAFVPRVGRRL